MIRTEGKTPPFPPLFNTSDTRGVGVFPTPTGCPHFCSGTNFRKASQISGSVLQDGTTQMTAPSSSYKSGVPVTLPWVQGFGLTEFGNT